MRRTTGRMLACAGMVLAPGETPAADPGREEVRAAVVKAVAVMHGDFGRDGGYVWVYSPDGKLRMGEGVADRGAAWVQPPGTPAVGEAFLAAYEVTRDERCLAAAKEAAHALVRGQLHSGGWYYRIDFAEDLRAKSNYRTDGGKSPKAAGPAGWETWKRRKNSGNRSMLDDDTTQSALRFLMKMDRALGGSDGRLRDAVEYGMEALMGTQYPVGAWSHNFDSFPDPPPDEEHYPVLRASYPVEWRRTWPKEWAGCYHLNDNITPDCIETLLLAHELYGEARFLESAMRGGEFLIRAQMPEPQPAWCQQYDKKMQPVWERKFEPPAVTGGESQGAMEVLIALFRATGEKRFLGPVPRALGYLEESRLPDGNLARYYELRTNRPLYFTKGYELTYDGSDVPDHYAFTTPSRLEKIGRMFREAVAGRAAPAEAIPGGKRVREILDARDDRGIWLEPGFVRNAEGKKVVPGKGVLSSRTFVKNVRALSRYLAAGKGAPSSASP